MLYNILNLYDIQSIMPNEINYAVGLYLFDKCGKYVANIMSLRMICPMFIADSLLVTNMFISKY